MDANILEGLAEVLLMTVALIVAGVGGLLLLSRSRLGEAVARRIAGDSAYSADQEQLDSLQDEVVRLRNQLSEMQERVEFAERLLSRADDKGRERSQGTTLIPSAASRMSDSSAPNRTSDRS
jgi:TolA-binding protein